MPESINAVAADIQADWIADGTKAAEPVTIETPAVETVVAQPRAADGTFASPTGAPASATPTPAVPASAASAAAPVSAVQEFIEAQLGDGVFQVPKGVKLPLKRGDTIEYATVEELQARGMMELDYRHKTADVARQRREIDARDTALRAEAAKVTARDTQLAEREAELVAAQKDPAKWQAYQQMQTLYQSNPQFRKTLDDALAKRETDAEIAVYREQDYRAQVQQGTDLAASWITEAAREFPGVSPERVRSVYAQALAAGQAQLDPAHVRAIYQQESGYLTASQGPLQKQLAELTAQVAALTASKETERANATTQHAVKRAQTPPVAVVGNAPVTVQPPAGSRFGPNELVERNAAWARQR